MTPEDRHIEALARRLDITRWEDLGRDIAAHYARERARRRAGTGELEPGLSSPFDRQGLDPTPDGYPSSSGGEGRGAGPCWIVDTPDGPERVAATGVELAAVYRAEHGERPDDHARLTREAFRLLSEAAEARDALVTTLNRLKAAERPTADPDGWCDHHWRAGIHEPRSDRYRSAGLCRSCGRFRETHGELPPVELLQYRDREGKWPSVAEVDRMMSSSKGRRAS